MFTKNSVGDSLCNFPVYISYFPFYTFYRLTCITVYKKFTVFFFIFFDISFVAFSKKISRKDSTNNSLYFLLYNLYFSCIIIPSHTLLINIHLQKTENTIIWLLRRVKRFARRL